MRERTEESMQIISVSTLPDLKIIIPHRHQDSRGFLSEVWREDKLRQAGIDTHFVQENHALSIQRLTLRGMHFQIGEKAQAKLIRCLRGRLVDVALDIRHGSPTFGQYYAHELSAEDGHQLYVPIGYAHGYCTLEANTEVLYKTSQLYDVSAERGFVWHDPSVAIPWRELLRSDLTSVCLSDKDKALPRLSELPPFFQY